MNLFPKIAVGTITTCYLDKSCYDGRGHWNVKVEILDSMVCDTTKQRMYLVKLVGENYVGCATHYRDPIDDQDPHQPGVLHCRDTRSYDSSAHPEPGIDTLETAIKSLGF
jgi:hypothetical protein